MKAVTFINDTAENKISFCHLALFMALLPFDQFYSELVLVSFVLHTLIHLKKNRLRLLLAKETWLPASVFILLFLSTLYSPDKKEGLDISGRQAALLIMPVTLALSNFDILQYKLKLLKVFSFTCTAVILYLYADALHTIFYFHLPANALFTAAFTNHNFSSPLDIHATYLSMYAALSVPVLLFCLLHSKSRKEQSFFIACMIVLTAGLVQLTSRAVVIALLVIVVAGFAFFLLQDSKKWIVTMLTVLAAVAAGTFVLQNNSFKQRYVIELKNDLANQPVTDEMLEPRIIRWELAAGLVKKSPLWGYGNGAEKNLLKETYFEHKLYISFLKGFNAHNQYLSFLLRCGIAGLLLFLFVMGWAFSRAFSNKDFLFFAFLVVTVFVSVSENILDVNKGIFFYSFFLSFFLLSNMSAVAGKATE